MNAHIYEKENPNCISKALCAIAFQKAKMKNQAMKDLQVQRGEARAQASSPEGAERQKQEWQHTQGRGGAVWRP